MTSTEIREACDLLYKTESTNEFDASWDLMEKAARAYADQLDTRLPLSFQGGLSNAFYVDKEDHDGRFWLVEVSP